MKNTRRIIVGSIGIILLIGLYMQICSNKSHEIYSVQADEVGTYCLEDVDIQDEYIQETKIKLNCTKEDIDRIELENELILKIAEIKNISNNKQRFLEYKILFSNYDKYFDPPETVYDLYTEEEIYLMQRCIETECYDADFDSKVNVASVILNRLYTNFNNQKTVTEVITAEKQFSYGRKNITEDTILALEYAVIFGDTTGGALYFHSNSKTSNFNNREYLFTDLAGHHFY